MGHALRSSHTCAIPVQPRALAGGKNLQCYQSRRGGTLPEPPTAASKDKGVDL